MIFVKHHFKSCELKKSIFYIIHCDIHCSSGDIYEGCYKDGKKHGKGKYKCYVEGRLHDAFDGRYRNGQKHGWGKMIFGSGDVYSGNYKADKASGRGKMVYDNKDGAHAALLQHRSSV
jgi:hypothetical protein